jgi:hypothetical protein
VVGYRCPEISSEWEQEMLAFVVGGVQIYVNSTFVTANLVAGNPKYGLASALHLLATNIWQVLSHRRCGPRTITAIQPVVLYILSAIKILREYERGVIFRLGRLLPHSKGPGLILVSALVDRGK